MIKVLLADDQSLVRSGFRMLIDSSDDMETVGEVENGRDAVAAVKARPVDVVLMDIRMPIMDGTEATRQIMSLGLDTKVLVLTTFDLDEYVFAALRNGASGFLLKDALPEELLGAIRAVAAGDAVVAPSTTKRLLTHFAGMLPKSTPEEDPPRRADGAGAGGAGGGRPGGQQLGDLAASVHGGGHGEDPHRSAAQQAGRARQGGAGADRAGGGPGNVRRGGALPSTSSGPGTSVSKDFRSLRRLRPSTSSGSGTSGVSKGARHSHKCPRKTDDKLLNS